MTDEDALWNLIATSQQAVLGTLRRDGRPQLSNVLYVVDAASRTIRISTQATRAKARNLRRDPRAVLHVTGDSFWSYAVAEGEASLSEVAASPDDQAVDELHSVHSAFYGEIPDRDTFAAEMITAGRLVIRLPVSRVYGLISTGGRRPVPGDDG